MTHVFERAATGRSKCRGCKEAIAKGELRFGEKLPNPFGEGEATCWYHPACAAYRRPDALLEALPAAPEPIGDAALLTERAQASIANPRLQRIDGAERAPTSQAKCRQCHEPIERGTWRVRLVLGEEGTFSPGGFLHVACRREYFGTDAVADEVLHFTRGLDEAQLQALREALAAS